MTDEDRKVVLVTGASRGLGRGIARHFGSAGATVYLTSRPASAEHLEGAASEVERLGGKAVPVAVDHLDGEEVRALIGRIGDAEGRLDILVNNAAAAHPQLSAPGAFWEKPLAVGDMIASGLHTNYITAYHAAPLMVAGSGGLIASISFYGAVTYFHGPAYGAAKAGTDKLSHDMALDLRPHDVAAVSIWPGFIYSDAVAGYVEQVPADKLPPMLAANIHLFERPEFTGMVIDALHDDPARMELSGRALIGAELGLRYGLSDLDGKQPQSFRETMGAPLSFFPVDPRRPMGA